VKFRDFYTGLTAKIAKFHTFYTEFTVKIVKVHCKNREISRFLQ
jgi:hypothetical protein